MTNFKSALLASLLFTSSSVLAQQPSSSLPTIKLSHGVVQGTTCSSTGVKRFRGIPYAQSAAGNNRFLPPKPYDGSLGHDSKPFDATQPAAPCVQYNAEFGVKSPSDSENCLTVDVYVPPDAQKSSRLPVKVWAYGGFNTAGGTSDPLYDACNLATDAVVVEFNYRVGPMGFLALDSAGIMGNMGIQDALAALEWVQDNIVDFGGNKSHVVMFGQSAGANDVFTISTLLPAPKLLSGVVVQSGGGTFVTPAKVAQDAGAIFAKALNCTGKEQQLSCLQKAPLDAIVKAYNSVPSLDKIVKDSQIPSSVYAIANPYKGGIASPMLDGKIVAAEPLAIGPKVPILAGAAERDASLLVIPELLHGPANFTENDYLEYLKYWGNDNAKKIAKRYPLALFKSAGTTAKAVMAALTTITTVSRLICPSYYIMQSAEVSKVDSYLYRWNHTLSCPFLIAASLGGVPFPTAQERDIFGPTHISDVPFAFGNLDRMPLGKGNCSATSAEHELSKVVRESWTAMASGNPSIRGLEWPRFDTCDSKGVVFEEEAKVDAIDFTECQFWGDIWNDITGGKVPFLGQESTCTNSSSGGSKPGHPTTSAATTSTASWMLYSVLSLLTVMIVP